MANFLQDVGMSKVGTSLSEYVGNQRTLAMNEALTTARVDQLKESTELTRNQLTELRRQQAENNKMVPYQVVLDRAKIPSVRDYIDKVARANAFVNADGTIRAGNARKLQELLQLDMHKSNISWMRLDHAESEYKKFKKASENPEYAKELKLKPEEVQQGLALATKSYVAAQAQNKAYQEHKKNQAEIELRRAQKAAAEAQKIKALLYHGDYTLSDEKLKVWKKYIIDPESLNDQEKDLIGVLVNPFLRTASNVVLSDLGNVSLSDEKKLKKILDMAKVFESASSGKQTVIKEPISEDIYDFYKREHGMTKEQVDEAYRQKYGK